MKVKFLKFHSYSVNGFIVERTYPGTIVELPESLAMKLCDRGVVEPLEEASEPQEGTPVETINGIGPKTAEELEEDFDILYTEQLKVALVERADELSLAFAESDLTSWKEQLDAE